MHPVERIRRMLLDAVLPMPVQARHAEYSLIASVDDEPSRPSPALIALALRAIEATQSLRLDALHARTGSPVDLINLWPGEHYRLLAGLVRVVQPRLIVEVGTGVGGSTLAMKYALPPEGRLVTFDVLDWRQVAQRGLTEEDFADGRLVQHLEDVSQPAGWARHRALFEEADLIYLDAAKDGALEQRLLAAFEAAAFRKSPLVVFDDIRVWNMLKVWRGIRRPKLDLTSFGHWTGTGLVDWQGDL